MIYLANFKRITDKDDLVLRGICIARGSIEDGTQITRGMRLSDVPLSRDGVFRYPS